jgi:hypothetical protein
MHTSCNDDKYDHEVIANELDRRGVYFSFGEGLQQEDYSDEDEDDDEVRCIKYISNYCDSYVVCCLQHDMFNHIQLLDENFNDDDSEDEVDEEDEEDEDDL